MGDFIWFFGKGCLLVGSYRKSSFFQREFGDVWDHNDYVSLYNLFLGDALIFQTEGNTLLWDYFL